MSQQYKGIILDFDGTLADSEPFYFRANREAFRRIGHEIDEKEYYYHWSLMGEGSGGEVDRYDLKGIDLVQVRNFSRQYYQNLVETETIELFDGAGELLHELPGMGFQVVIASNTRRDLINLILRRAGFEEIPVPVIGGDGLQPKPAPDIFLKAQTHLNLPKENCLILEDTDKGVRAARAARIPFGVIQSRLYPDYSPDDAIQKFSNLQAFMDFITGQ